MHRIGLVSDVHARPESLQQALRIFQHEGVETILCAGDIAGYNNRLDETIALLQEAGAICIAGNHDRQWLVETSSVDVPSPSQATRDFLDALPLQYRTCIEGVSIHMAHAEPPDRLHGGIRLLDRNGEVLSSLVNAWQKKLAQLDADVLIVGHTHQVYARQLEPCLLINPGSTACNNSCAILSLPDKSVRFHALSGQGIIKSWHWGMNVEGLHA